MCISSYHKSPTKSHFTDDAEAKERRLFHSHNLISGRTRSGTPSSCRDFAPCHPESLALLLLHPCAWSPLWWRRWYACVPLKGLAKSLEIQNRANLLVLCRNSQSWLNKLTIQRQWIWGCFRLPEGWGIIVLGKQSPGNPHPGFVQCLLILCGKILPPIETEDKMSDASISHHHDFLTHVSSRIPNLVNKI